MDESRPSIAKADDQDRPNNYYWFERNTRAIRRSLIGIIAAVALNMGVNIYHEVAHEMHDSNSRSEYIILDYDQAIGKHDESEHLPEDEVDALKKDIRELQFIIDSLKSERSFGK